MLQLIYNWVAANYFETIAALLGLIAIVLQIKQNAWYWIVSIVMVSMYVYIYITAKLYADMSLQFYYLGVSFYGWYLWFFGKEENSSKISINVSKASLKLRSVMALLSILFFILIALILINFTNSDVPFLDAFTTALSFIATWMLARKLIENWLIWIVVDVVSTGIYIYKELYPTAILFAILSVLAVVGYKEWKKDLIINHD